ncbi:Ribosomal protein S18 acetylase RimI [Propionibacterium cyclohexanicum]|uniref:Ribosomal protein S18 acetylase RimI n=1 Tax=Propionibacterium cyclohexanicum TaxID=64702 RepID=A0A1H9PP61_9ACTN|nr:GNAT family N-acetyltransferase [Propionibacterium cyclohexanicum]SER49994.1 Ribosomal protein S18 acetylase RimI [Propionibacterium cyclohexanicum]
MNEQPDSDAGFVRLAMPAEATRLAALQREAWSQGGLAEFLPSPSQVANSWREAIVHPPLASYRLLVAVDAMKTEPIGFVAVGPSDDPDAGPRDGLVGEFVVSPRHRGAGHGSRLLHAAVDTLAADGFVRATWWLLSNDDALRGFLTSAGWGPDGAHREIGTPDGSIRLRQIRMHTGIA